MAKKRRRKLGGKTWKNPWLAGASIALVVIVGYVAVRSFAAGDPPIASITTTELGTVHNPSAPYLSRDGGASTSLGGRMLWTFGDTVAPGHTGLDGQNLRSSTAAYAPTNNPTIVSEPLDRNGSPTDLLPLTAAEKQYNATSGNGAERYALWPAFVVPESSSTALVFYHRLLTHPSASNLTWDTLGTGVARLNAGSTVATRLTDTLFTDAQSLYDNAYVVAGDYLYLYACNTANLCKVARTSRNTVLSHAGYQYWDGRSWTSNSALASRSIPGSTSGFSISYSPYVGQFVSVAHAAPFSPSIVLRTAPNPEGPWSNPRTIYTAASGIYATYQHPELSGDNGKSLYVSYYRSTGDFKGEMKLVKFTLTVPPSGSSGATSSSKNRTKKTTTTAAKNPAPAAPTVNPTTESAATAPPSTTSPAASHEPWWQTLWGYITAPFRVVWQWASKLF